MGYTHYHFRKGAIPESKWKAYISDLKLFLKWLEEKKKIKVAGPDGRGEPVFRKDYVAFNGKGRDASETFCITRLPMGILFENLGSGKPEKLPRNAVAWHFTKTNRRKYDVAVVGAEVLALMHFPEKHFFSSDGIDSKGLDRDFKKALETIDEFGYYTSQNGKRDEKWYWDGIRKTINYVQSEGAEKDYTKIRKEIKSGKLKMYYEAC